MAILVALAVFVLVLGAGAAVDMARAQILHTKIQSSLDASALAALKSVSSTPSSTTQAAWARQQAQRYFNANFPLGYLQTSPIVIQATLSADANTINLKTNSVQTTSFMKMVGINTVTVGASSTVTRTATSQSTELVLVLDNTLSMNCDVHDNSDGCDTVSPKAKILALKSAATTMLNIIYGGNETSNGLYVGIVPFSQVVNIGTSHIGWLDADGKTGAQNVAAAGSFGTTTWSGCVVERADPFSETEDAPINYSPYQFKPFRFAPEPTTDAAQGAAWKIKYGYYYNWNPEPDPVSTTWRIRGWDFTNPTGPYTSVNGPNNSCPQAILPMVAEKTVVINNINTLSAMGDTLISEGLVWGWRMLSPNWRNQWGGEMDANAQPRDYAVANRKVVVMMTDGKNRLSPYAYTGYGWLWDFSPLAGGDAASTASVTAQLDQKTRNICTAMKAKGITIWTIGFGDASSVNVSLLQQCATDVSHALIAPSDADLDNAFRIIGNSLVNLRVSQ